MNWLMIGVIIISIIIVNFAIHGVLRKIYKIEKKKIFSYNHVNSLHRKLDWIVRIANAVVLFIVLYFSVFHNYSINLMLLATSGFIVLQGSIQVYFECKKSATPKHSILTISDVLLGVIIITLLIQFDVITKLIS